MPVTSSISFSLEDKTCILSIQGKDTPATQLIYTDDSKSIRFSARPQIIQTKADMQNYLEQFVNFNTTILNNFSKLDNTIPIEKIEWRYEKKTVQKTIDFEFKKNSNKLLEIEADLDKRQLVVKARPQEVFLTFSEWEIYLKLFKYFVNRLPF